MKAKGQLDRTVGGFCKISREKRGMRRRDFENQISLADAGEIGGELNSQDGEKDTPASQEEVVDGLLDGAQVVLVALEKCPPQSHSLQVVEGSSQQQDPPADNPAGNRDRGKEANHQLPTDPPELVGRGKLKQCQHEAAQHEQHSSKSVDEVLDNDRRGACLRRNQPRNHRELRGLTQQGPRRGQVVQALRPPAGAQRGQAPLGAARRFGRNSSRPPPARDALLLKAGSERQSPIPAGGSCGERPRGHSAAARRRTARSSRSRPAGRR